MKVEGHITRDLTPAVWLSLDALFMGGGETSVDGVDQQNAQSSLGIGGTVGLNLSQAMILQATYGNPVAQNESGADAVVWRVRFSAFF